jgi:hypothetical protein
MLIRGIELDLNSEEFFGCSEEAMLLDSLSSVSILPEEVVCLWCARDFFPEDRRYWRAGRKGLGESVFRAENMGIWDEVGEHLSKYSCDSRRLHFVESITFQFHPSLGQIGRLLVRKHEHLSYTRFQGVAVEHPCISGPFSPTTASFELQFRETGNLPRLT